MIYKIAALAGLMLCTAANADPVHVGPHNFVRAESDRYMAGIVEDGGFGEISLGREPVDLADQPVIRMNLDTIYSSGVFDMEAGPVSITLPDAPDGRYMSAQILTQDHLTVGVYHDGTNTFSAEDVDTRYAVVIIRVFMDATDPDDIAYANQIQENIIVEQNDEGEFNVPIYDEGSLNRTRMALLQLGALARGNFGTRMGTREEIDPIAHLIVTAVGWGLLPEAEAAYFGGAPVAGHAALPHELILSDVPTNAFWSVTVYNARGFMVANDLGVNAINNVNGVQSADGSYRVQFGDCDENSVNCIPVPEGWNYVFFPAGQCLITGDRSRDGSGRQRREAALPHKDIQCGSSHTLR